MNKQCVSVLLAGLHILRQNILEVWIPWTIYLLCPAVGYLTVWGRWRNKQLNYLFAMLNHYPALHFDALRLKRPWPKAFGHRIVKNPCAMLTYHADVPLTSALRIGPLWVHHSLIGCHGAGAMQRPHELVIIFVHGCVYVIRHEACDWWRGRGFGTWNEIHAWKVSGH